LSKASGGDHALSDKVHSATHPCSAGSNFAFIGLPEDDDVNLAILPHTEGAMVNVSFIF